MNGNVSPEDYQRMWAPALYYVGFLAGATNTSEVDHTETLKGCFNPDEDLTDTLFEAYEALTEGDTKRGNELLEQTKPEFEKAMENCDQLLE